VGERWNALSATLASLTEIAHAKRDDPGKSLRVHEALHRSLAHTAYHVGQIVLIAKEMKGASWKSLSIPSAHRRPTTARRPRSVRRGSGPAGGALSRRSRTRARPGGCRARRLLEARFDSDADAARAWNAPVTVQLRGASTFTTSSRIRLVTCSWNTPSSGTTRGRASAISTRGCACRDIANRDRAESG